MKAWYKDLTNLRFGKRVVQWPVGRKWKYIMWLCLCDCGSLLIIPSRSILSGTQNHCSSCGHTTHGLAYTVEYKMWAAAKYRAKKDGVPFNINPQDIKIPEKCPLLGISLIQRKGSGTNHGSPTLDRIIPSLGYVSGNVQVISSKANLMKNDSTLEEMELLVKNWREQVS
jgi:hypothetical protein